MSTPENKAISTRACEEIVHRAYGENNTSIAEEVDLIGACRQQYYAWEHHRCAPSAATLARMADAGYDVMYILTGRKADNGRS